VRKGERRQGAKTGFASIQERRRGVKTGGAKTGIASVDFIAVAARGGSKLAGLTCGE
jgi:hypothetical protein